MLIQRRAPLTGLGLLLGSLLFGSCDRDTVPPDAEPPPQEDTEGSGVRGDTEIGDAQGAVIDARAPSDAAGPPLDARPVPTDVQNPPRDARPSPADTRPAPADARPSPADVHNRPADARPPRADATCTPGPELCDGQDNDCDGQIDEDFDLAAPCEVGQGACAAAGRRICNPAGAGTRCEGTPRDPGTERCGTGVDEDCDGEIDEGFDVGAPCYAYVHGCAFAGVKVCVDEGRRTTCDLAPMDRTLRARVTVSAPLNLPPGTPIELTSVQARSADGPFGIGWSATINGRSQAFFSTVAANPAVAPTVVELGEAEGAVPEPAVAWNGQIFGVAWPDGRDGGNPELYFQRFGANGAAIGEALRLTATGDYSTDPAVIWLDDAFAITWVDTRDGNQEIYYTRVSGDGAPQGDARRITFDFNRSFDPTLAPNHHGVGMAWIDTRNGVREIYFMRLSAQGVPLVDPRPVTHGVHNPRLFELLWTGQHYGLLWVESIDGQDTARFGRLSHQGELLEGSVVTLGPATATTHEPTMVRTGSGFGLAWHDPSPETPGLHFREISAQGGQVGERVRIVPGARARTPSLVWTGTAYGLAYFDHAEGPPHVYFARGLPALCGRATPCEASGFEPEIACGLGRCREAATASACIGGMTRACQPGIPTPFESLCDGHDEDCNGRPDDVPARIGFDRRLTVQAAASRTPVLVWNGADFGVAWLDERNQSSEVYFTRISATGERLSPDVRVSNLAAGGTARDVRAVWGDGGFGVAWTDNRAGNNDIYFARLNADGVLQGDNLRVTDNPADQRTPTIAWAAGEYGLAWRDSREGHGLEIYFTRLSADGRKLGDDLRVTEDPGQSVTPTLAWNGQSYGLLWRDFRANQADLYFTRLSNQGAKLDPDQRVTQLGASLSPTLVWTGEGYGAAFIDDASGHARVHFIRITANGRPAGEPVPLSPADADAFEPTQVWTGTRHAIAWDESTGQFREIMALQISVDGAPHGEPVRISEYPWRSREPSLQWTGTDLTLIWADFRHQEEGTADELYWAHGPLGDCDPINDCRAMARAEICNGTDDDCDGVVDETCRQAR